LWGIGVPTSGLWRIGVLGNAKAVPDTTTLLQVGNYRSSPRVGNAGPFKTSSWVSRDG
jgi:hypothetical protein